MQVASQGVGAALAARREPSWLIPEAPCWPPEEPWPPAPRTLAGAVKRARGRQPRPEDCYLAAVAYAGSPRLEDRAFAYRLLAGLFEHPLFGSRAMVGGITILAGMDPAAAQAVVGGVLMEIGAAAAVVAPERAVNRLAGLAWSMEGPVPRLYPAERDAWARVKNAPRTPIEGVYDGVRYVLAAHGLSTPPTPPFPGPMRLVKDRGNLAYLAERLVA